MAPKVSRHANRFVREVFLPAGLARTSRRDLFLVTGPRREGRPEVWLSGTDEALLEVVPDAIFAGVRIPANVLVFRRKRPAAPRRVTVGGFFEPVEPLKWLVYDGAEDEIFVYSADADEACVSTLGPPKLVRSLGGVTAFAAQLYDVGAYLADLGEVLAGDGRTLRDRARMFFADYELNTHPKLIPFLALSPYDMEIRRQAIREIMIDLRFRFEERAHIYSARPTTTRFILRHRASKCHGAFVQYLSDIQRDVIERHFGRLGPNFRLDELERAFEMFANGELRDRRASAYIGQPSSGFYYFFAEFALLAVDAGVQTDLWRQVANAMVRTQEIFTRVYAPTPVPANATYADYNACNYDKARALSESQKTALAGSFAGRSLAELTARVARSATTHLTGI